MNHQYIYDTPMNVGRLVGQVADKSQTKTQNSSKRPYGVGMLVVGVDEKGPRLFETCPSGNHFEYYAMAIGGKSTSAKTYLEKHFSSFGSANLDDLIQHAVEAKNTAVAVIGKGEKFRELKADELQKYIDKLEKKAELDVTMGDAAASGGDGGAAPTDVSQG